MEKLFKRQERSNPFKLNFKEQPNTSWMNQWLNDSNKRFWEIQK